MKHLMRLSLLVSLAICLIGLSLGVVADESSQLPAGPHLSARQNKDTELVPGRILIRFTDETTLSQRALSLARLGVEIIEHETLLNVEVARVPEGQEAALAAMVDGLPGVVYAEPEHLYRAHATPNDPYYGQGVQWNLPHINLPATWDITTGDADVIVAVLDTGLDTQHPDLAGQSVAGYDFCNNDADPSDDEGHGTHVSGIISAASNNGVGVVGVSWHGKIMPVKVLDSDGSGSDSQVANGITWAVDHGADIINMSLGGPGYSNTIANAVNYAYSQGVLLLASMGNDYEEGNPTEYPAALDHVVAVGAVGNLDERAAYSCTGPHLDLMAPGGNATSSYDNDPNHWIASTYWRGSGDAYAWIVGTSQSCPHVAGVAALMLAVNPTLTHTQLEQILKDTSVDLGSSGFDQVFGYGRVDAHAAVVAAQAQAQPTATATRTASATPTPAATSTPTLSISPTPSVTRTPFPDSYRRCSLPLILGKGLPLPSATPRPTLTPTPSGAAPQVLPRAGIWYGDDIYFTIATDRRHIRYVDAYTDCTDVRGRDIDIASDGTWQVSDGDSMWGGTITGQFVSATECTGLATGWENYQDYPHDRPCTSNVSWIAWPE